jgi:uncharacterized membrane protein YhhN
MITQAALSLAALGSGILHVLAEYHGPRLQIYLFKPLTMILILALAFLRAKAAPGLYGRAVIGGLLCSLAGDVFLMLPSDRFLPGLASFLLAHLFYIAAFTDGFRFGRSCRALWPFGLYGLLIFLILLPTLGPMKWPVLGYILVILAMGWQAWVRWAATGRRPALWAFLGALLFIVSDSVLALNRFYQPLGPAQAVILSTYFTAQWLITLSIGRGT